MGNPVVHFEILGEDLEALSAFYREIFEWQVERVPEMPYALVNTGENALAGGIGEPQSGVPMVTFYIEVPDIEDTLQRIESAGGSTMMPRTELGMVTIAMFKDPEGHAIGLVEAASEDEEQEDEEDEEDEES
jgi:predicted enzyme related to lactoylglutathione lyase